MSKITDLSKINPEIEKLKNKLNIKDCRIKEHQKEINSLKSEVLVIKTQTQSELFISRIRMKNLEESLINSKAKDIQRDKGIKSNSDLSSELYMDQDIEEVATPVGNRKNKTINLEIKKERKNNLKISPKKKSSKLKNKISFKTSASKHSRKRK
mmetsp:Transcript_9812/g.8641  ORF Transcript_9812/g.8641 Transcript_9812/m.8641 type:complete len:154 (-) Transcript_9812:26-487(-)